jgi:hypothetical protein
MYAGGVMVAGQGVADQDGIGAILVGLPIGLIYDLHGPQLVARFQHQRVLTAPEDELLRRYLSD